MLILTDASDLAETVKICAHMRWPRSQVHEVSNLENAVAILASRPITLAVLDLNWVGADLLGSLIHQMRDVSANPIILVTDRAMKEKAIKALEMGADNYITKPVSHLEMMGLMKAVLRLFPVPD